MQVQRAEVMVCVVTQVHSWYAAMGGYAPYMWLRHTLKALPLMQVSLFITAH